MRGDFAQKERKKPKKGQLQKGMPQATAPVFVAPKVAVKGKDKDQGR